jgi:putative zinc finger protein
MMRILSCDEIREDLTAYHDGELSLDEQVRVQTHLQECIACRLEFAAISDLGDALRTMAGSVPRHTGVETGRITSGVLERIRVERQFSLAAQCRDWFQDMHLVWAGLGATVAMAICIFASAGVLQAASQEKPESLAGIITTLANQGTNDYPLQLAGTMLAPRAMMNAPMPTADEDGEFALSAVVTREGRIQNLEVLVAEQARALHVKPEVVVAMLDLASRARFEPAISGGLPVAVNVVWLVTSTTVKGRPDYDRYLVHPPRLADPLTGPAPSAKPSHPPAKTPTAGSDDGLTAA